MDSSQVTTEQAKQIGAAIGPMLRYLGRLRDRMEKRSFPKDDELYRLVVKAHDDIHHLSVTLHYLTCDGVGRPSQRKRPRRGAGTPGPLICPGFPRQDSG